MINLFYKNKLNEFNSFYRNFTAFPQCFTNFSFIRNIWIQQKPQLETNTSTKYFPFSQNKSDKPIIFAAIFRNHQV